MIKRLLLGLLLLLLPSLGWGDITTGLVGHWPFDDGTGTAADDATANNNTGLLNGSAALPAWITGRVGPWALAFDNTNWVEIAHTAALNPNSFTQLTVACWARVTTGGVVAGIVTKWGASGERVFFLGINATVFELNVNQGMALLQSPPFTVGQWYHLVATWTASTSVRLSVDGAEVATDTTTIDASLLANTNPWGVGVRSSGGAVFDLGFFGEIDDVRMYNRALTAGDVTELFTGGVSVIRRRPLLY